MGNTRSLSYWWPNGFPTKWGLCVPWQNYNGAPPITSMTASAYFNTKFFGSTAAAGVAPGLFTSTVSPYHGVVPPFYSYRYDFPEGWEQTNWKTAMYLPMLFEAKTTAPTYANFKSLLQQYPNKLVLIGNEPNDVNQGNTTPAEFAAAIDDLHTVSPNMQWIGPNIIFPFATPGNENNLNTTLGWCNAYHNLIVARPDRKPTRWSFHIYAENTVKWNEYWTMLCQWMIAHNYKVNSYTPTPVVLTETSLSRPDATLAEQQTLLSIISALMNRAASPLAQTFIYCASDDSPHGTLDEYSNNELMQPSGAVYAYRTLGTTWDALARWLYSTVPPRRPWPAPARAPATVRAARPILSPSL